MGGLAPYPGAIDRLCVNMAFADSLFLNSHDYFINRVDGLASTHVDQWVSFDFTWGSRRLK